MSRPLIECVFALPTSVFGAILCNWLDLKFVCRLDSAICKKTNRTEFLNLLQSVECIGQFCASKKEQLVWINMRSIKSKTFVWLWNFWDNECQMFLQRSGHCVQNIHITSAEGSLQTVAQYCHRLLCCTVHYAGDCSELLMANPKLVDLTMDSGTTYTIGTDIALPNLEHISLGNIGFDDNSLMSLVKCSSRLCSLWLSHTNITSTGMINAVRFCPLLRSLQPADVHDIDYALLDIAIRCPNMEELCLIHCASLTDAGIVAVSKNVKALRSIQFMCTYDITNRSLLSLAAHQHQTLEVVMVYERWFETSIDAFPSASVPEFREKCPKLHTFEWEMSLRRLTLIDNATIATHLTNADRFTTLTMPHLDNAILETIARYCTGLKRLNLQEVTVDAIGACSDTMWLQVAQRCVHLNSIFLVDEVQCLKLQNLLVGYPTIQINTW